MAMFPGHYMYFISVSLVLNVLHWRGHELALTNSTVPVL